MDVAGYSQRAEACSAELAGAVYRHYAGLAPELALREIYDRHADLFATAAIDELRAAVDGRDEPLRSLLRFAAHGRIAAAVCDLESEMARREARLSVQLPADRGAGQRIGFRESAIVQAGEPDGERRAAIDAARRLAAREALAPLAKELHERRMALTRELGWPCYRALCEQASGVDLLGLGRQAGELLDRTDDVYAAVVADPVRATLGVGPGRLRRSDLGRFLRQATSDSLFPSAGLLGSLSAALGQMGLDLQDGSGIVLDTGRRAGKSPRAFCAPVRVPQEVYLVVAPLGGREDYAALLHEAGHALHFAGTGSQLALAQRRLGDPAQGEGFAFLLEGLLDDAGWQQRALGIEDGDGALAARARARRLMLLRRHAAKLQYELELHGEASAQAQPPAASYARHLSRALGVHWPPDTWLTDVDPAMYVADYLRAWAFEARLREGMRERFGSQWFADPAAGAMLRGLWAAGQRARAEDVLGELGLTAGLDFAALASEFVAS